MDVLFRMIIHLILKVKIKGQKLKTVKMVQLTLYLAHY
jgi:hypothetical protein